MKIYHNPRCSRSRQTLAIIREKGEEVEIVEYLNNPPNKIEFKQGAETIEAYPIISKKDKMPDVFAWVGFTKAYKNAGFEVIGQPSETRLIMRISKEKIKSNQ